MMLHGSNTVNLDRFAILFHDVIIHFASVSIEVLVVADGCIKIGLLDTQSTDQRAQAGCPALLVTSLAIVSVPLYARPLGYRFAIALPF